MNLSNILSISGKTGLYRLVAQTKTGALVESLLDGKRCPAFSYEKISSLEDIGILTTGEDIPLKDVFKAIFEKENGQSCLDSKSNPEKIKNYLLEVIPTMDLDRVYPSDMKKILLWYNILLQNEIIKPEEEKEKQEKISESNED